jgi:hypothetical protein
LFHELPNHSFNLLNVCTIATCIDYTLYGLSTTLDYTLYGSLNTRTHIHTLANLILRTSSRETKDFVNCISLVYNLVEEEHFAEASSHLLAILVNDIEAALHRQLGRVARRLLRCEVDEHDGHLHQQHIGLDSSRLMRRVTHSKLSLT